MGVGDKQTDTCTTTMDGRASSGGGGRIEELYVHGTRGTSLESAWLDKVHRHRTATPATPWRDAVADRCTEYHSSTDVDRDLMDGSRSEDRTMSLRVLSCVGGGRPVMCVWSCDHVSCRVWTGPPGRPLVSMWSLCVGEE